MAEEIDRKLMPEFLRTTFEVSLGACYKSVEMMKDPMGSADKMMGTMKSLFTIPSNAGEGLQKKAEAIAGIWMEKGMDIIGECRTAGQKFTEGK